MRPDPQPKDEADQHSDVMPINVPGGSDQSQFCRPTKKPVATRLDSDVIAWLKADGRGYQTKASRLLRHAMLNGTGEKSPSKQEGIERRRKGKETMLGLQKILGE